MTLPINFLYLGGDKCGSTWIHHILSQHKDVKLAHAKELFYFDRFYDKGPNWYLRQFPKADASKRMGEICHDYLYSERALHRIAADLPATAQFLITVRNPVSRTLSHYKYLLKIGRTKLSFAEALKAYPQLVDHSKFGKYVQLAQDILGHARVHVLPFEQLAEDPVQFGRRISRALDIEFDPNLSYADKILQAQAARNPTLVRLLRNTGWVVRSIGAPRLVGAVKSSAAVHKLLFSSSKLKSKPSHVTPELLSLLDSQFGADQALLRACVPDLQFAA
ncbi:MAG: sulfotransferase [Paracoccaceae bacterium]